MPKKATMSPADEGIQAAREDARQAAQIPDIPDVSVEITKMLDDPEGKTRAYAKLTVAGMLELDGLRIVEGQNGLFCSMPTRKGQDGKYYPIARTVGEDFKQIINDVAVGAYQAQALEQQQAPPEMAEPEMGM